MRVFCFSVWWQRSKRTLVQTSA